MPARARSWIEVAREDRFRTRSEIEARVICMTFPSRV
jgi:hypothetical protein